MTCNSLSASVYNPPSDPVTQLPETFAISVAHDNQARLSIFGDVRSFVGVAINLDHAAGGRPSNPIEDQSAFYFAAGRALKCMMLIAGHHHGGVPNYCIKRISAPQGTQRIARTRFDRVGSFSTMRTWSNGRGPNYPQACVAAMLRNP